jgi:predicted PhzF superfamily epimerase YddE/YHI9
MERLVLFSRCQRSEESVSSIFHVDDGGDCLRITSDNLHACVQVLTAGDPSIFISVQTHGTVLNLQPYCVRLQV